MERQKLVSTALNQGSEINDLRQKIEREQLQAEEKIRGKDEEISRMLKDFDTETKDLKQKREIDRLQAEGKIKEKDEEIRKLLGMLQNLEIETKDFKNTVEKNKIQTEVRKEDKEKEAEIESDRKDFLINIVAPPRQVTELHGKIIQGPYIQHYNSYFLSKLE